MPEKIELLANEILSEPVKIEVNTNSATVDTIKDFGADNASDLLDVATAGDANNFHELDGTAGDIDSIEAALTAAAPFVDKMVTKGIMHKNKAARVKSRLNAAVVALKG